MSAQADLDRKFATGFCGLCIIAFAACLLIAAVCAIHSSPWAIVWLIAAVIAWWWGSSAADVLRKNPQPETAPINWRQQLASDKEWVGCVGDRWNGFELFRIERDNFIETGETYCLHSQLSRGCVSCYPTLELAQKRAEEQLRELLKVAKEATR